MAPTIDAFLDRLSEEGRILLIGGLAVIAHGFSRSTKDGDIWLEPLASPGDWSAAVRSAMKDFPSLTLFDLAARERISPDQLCEVVRNSRVVRIHGLAMPLDVFRKPHNFESEDFDAVYRRSVDSLQSSVKVVSELDLIFTKDQTGRDHDLRDIQFLEAKIIDRLGAELIECSRERAREIMDEFLDFRIAEKALQNPLAEVRAMGEASLKALAAEGDPFATEALEKQGGYGE